MTVISLAYGIVQRLHSNPNVAGRRVHTAMAAIALLMFSSACTPVPKQEFKAYTEAFDSAKQSVEQALADMDAAEEIVKRIKESRTPKAQATPTITLKVDLTSSVSADISESVKRRKALEAISRFNDVMLALAEGRSDEEVKQTVDGFVANLSAVGDLVGTSIPGSQVVLGTVTTVIGLLQKAENRAQFIEGMQQAAPIIDKILVIFARDTERVFSILARDTDNRLRNFKNEIFDLSLQMEKVAKEYQAPTAALQSSQKAVSDDLAAALAATGQSAPQPILPDGGPGAPKAYDAIALSQLQQTLKQAQEAAVAYAAVVEAHKARTEAALAHGRLLSQIRASLTAVLMAMERPQNIRAQALDLVGTAFEAKRKWETWRAADRAAASK